jgi:hypothetical protein
MTERTPILNILHIALVIVAIVCFGFAAFAWPAPMEPYRVRFVGAGLMFWALSTFF